MARNCEFAARAATTGLAVLLASLPATPAQAACHAGILAALPVTMEGMRASVPVAVNGKQTTFWLDSGAFFSTMSRAKAAEFALPLDNLPVGFQIVGIGGSASPMLTTIKSFVIAGQKLDNVQFLVGGSDPGNGFIGLNLLSLVDAEYDLANGSVRLIEPHDCRNTNFAYWAGDKPVRATRLLSGENERDRHIYAQALVNGKPVRVMFDTGAPSSSLTRKAAEAAGIDLSAPGVVGAARAGGIGRATLAGWIARMTTFDLGGEEIRNSPIRVIDGDFGSGETQMILGADFFLSHHIYVSRSQHMIFFTYNGGPVFSINLERELAGHVPTTRGETGDDTVAQPKSADDFARRGNARLVRRDFDGALADLSQAIALSPNDADYYASRARAYGESHRPLLARADFDKAIALAPGDPDLLSHRAFIRLDAHDQAGALADGLAAARLYPAGSLDMLALVVLFERLHRPELGLAQLDAMIKLHREDNKLGLLLNARCWNRALANADLDQALKDCNTAIRKDGARPAYLDSRGMVEFRQGNNAAAIADYDAALKVQPDLASSLYMRGQAELAAGQKDAGARDVAAAQALSPDVADRFTPYGIGK